VNDLRDLRCYRHPDRETAVSCSGCGRPICTDCMTPSPVGMRCPECAGRASGVRRVSSAVSRSDTPYATYVLIAVNVAVFIAEVATSAGAASIEGGGRLIRDGGLLGPAISNDGEVYRIVTAGFLHAGPLHLLFNMFALYVLGTLLEPAIGMPRFCGIYLAGLLAGSFGALLLSPDQNTVGASGAIFGLFGAAFLIARRRQLENLASQIGLWLVLNLVFTLSIPGISIGGHLGGLVGGTLAAFVITAGERRVGGRAAVPIEVAGILAICAVSVAGALAVA
jgi:membrane associated rhomboid family serine protease